MPDDETPLTLADSIRRKIAESQENMPPTPLSQPKSGALQIHLEFSETETKVNSISQKARAIGQQVCAENMKNSDGGRFETVNARMKDLVDKATGPFTAAERGQLLEQVRNEVFGFGPLSPLLKDPTVSHIFVNGCSNVYVQREGQNERVNVSFEDDQHLNATIEKILGPLGLRLDENNPMVSARMPNGAPVEICGPPLSIDGPTISINCAISSPCSLGQMIEAKMLTPNLADVLSSHVKKRSNIIVSGFGDVSQNRMVSALSAHIPHTERVISIETTASFRLMQEHWIRFELTPSMRDRSISMRSLVDKALRMRPDRIILGDCNGDEAFDLLEACAHGTTRSIMVINASSVTDCLRRLEQMVGTADSRLTREQTLELINEGVQLIVHLSRFPDGTCRVTEVSEITGSAEQSISEQD